MKNLSLYLALILVAGLFSCQTPQPTFEDTAKTFPKSKEDAQMRADFQSLREYIFINTATFEKSHEFLEIVPTDIEGIEGDLALSYLVGDVGSTKVFFKTQNYIFYIHLSVGEGGKGFAIWTEKFEYVWDSIPTSDPDNDDPSVAKSKKMSTWESNEISPNKIVAHARQLFIDH